MGVVIGRIDRLAGLDVVLGSGSGRRVTDAVLGRVRAGVRDDDLVTATAEGFEVVTDGRLAVRDVVALADRLVAAVAGPVELDDGTTVEPIVRVGCSARFVEERPAFGAGANRARRDGTAQSAQAELSAEARLAVEAAGGAGVAVFDADLASDAEAAILADRTIGRRVLDERLQVHYQPIRSAVDGRLVGVEALARWFDPIRGQLLPRSFLPVAEARGFGADLDGAVATVACRDLARWSATVGRPLWVGLNVSRSRLASEPYRRVLDGAVAASGLDRSQVLLEVPGAEPAASIDAGGYRRVVDGVDSAAALLGIAEGAEGTGPAMAKLAPGLADRRVRPVLEAMIDVARSLGVEVVVQGIEDPDDVPALAARGVRWVQGFGLGRPIGADAVEALAAVA